MATTSAEESNPYEYLRTFTIIWLDTQVNVRKDNRKAQKQLDAIAKCLITFEDWQECDDYIRSALPDHRYVLIVTDQLGRELVSHIHHIQQISSIYIYCGDKKINTQWTKQFRKIKYVIDRLDELISRIQSDHKMLVPMSKPLSNSSSTTSDAANQFMTNLHDLDSPVAVIECFLRIEFREKDKDQFHAFYKNIYKDVPFGLAILRGFQEKYSSQKAVWWYTNRSVMYEILNKALGEANIYALFLSRFLIRDMYRHLKQYQCQSPIRVYRGKYLSDNELDQLKASVGKLNSASRFFSASSNRQVVLKSLQWSSEDKKKVLFEIDADPCVATMKPFANISQHACLSSEQEVLFMAGSVFRIDDVCLDNDQIWTIRMTLSAGNEHDWQEFFKHMQKMEDDYEKLTILSFGKILRQMGKFNSAEAYYHRLLTELTSDNPMLGLLYYELGEIASSKGDHNASDQWHNKLLEMKMGTKLAPSVMSIVVKQ